MKASLRVSLTPRLRMNTLSVAMSTVTLVALLSVGCGGSVQDESARTRSGSVLRTAWDEPDLSGVWKVAETPAQDPFQLASLERLYTPAAQAKMKQMSPKDDPTLRCGVPAFPRALNLGTPIQLVQTPGFIVVIPEAFPMYRIIPTNDRQHLPDNLRLPRNMGDSTARWDGDTLVVDVIAFDGDSWLAGAEDKPTNTSTGVWPTSDAMHVVERWSRVDADTLEYQARVEDPQLLSGAWDTPKIRLKRQPVDRIEEALCLTDDGPSSYLERIGYRR